MAKRSILSVLLILTVLGGDASAASVIFTLKPEGRLEAGKTTKVTAVLTSAKDGHPITLSELKEAHTRKIHLLVIDPSLSDYHHLHPVEGEKPGEYSFDFTPLKNDAYRVWADLTQADTGKQEYAVADMGTIAETRPAMDKNTVMNGTERGYEFRLTLEGKPKAGEEIMGGIAVSKNGKPFRGLQPVMGAFAHVVGFGEDYNSVLHVHPMGKEPSTPDSRGGPKLIFHLEPKNPGFFKLFAQFRIDNRDIFIPFGIMVEEN